MQVSASGGAPSAAMMQRMRERMFERADTDRNGGLSLAEFTAVQPRRGEGSSGKAASSAVAPASDAEKALFSKLDANGDSYVSAREIRVAFAPPIGGEARSEGPPRGAPPPAGPPPRGDQDKESSGTALASSALSTLLQQQSSSGSAPPSSPASASDKAKLLLSILDGNGDGTVTLAEIEGAFGLTPPGTGTAPAAGGATSGAVTPVEGEASGTAQATADSPAVAEPPPEPAPVSRRHRHHHHHDGDHGRGVGGLAGQSMASLLLAQQAGGSAASGTPPVADPDAATFEQIGRLMAAMMEKMVQAYASARPPASTAPPAVSAVA